ncbi:MAG: diaminopimelate dehydrogenase, partial [Tissierellia bacterium]|nr:diaminopimelate dehydrogenase [Tissierellia bacterium]
MYNKIRVGIVGYGNLGKGVELALNNNPDFELIGIFTRRNVKDIDSNSNIIPFNKVLDYKDKIDVMFLCGGSAKDLPEQCPKLAEHFNTIDSYDNHKNIPKYFDMIDNIAKKSNKVSLISV